MVQYYLTCYHPSPGNPQDKSSRSVLGVGNCLKRSCPGGREVGQIKNHFSLILQSTRYFSRGLHEAAKLKTTYFRSKIHEFVGEWLERKNLSKLKSVFLKIQTNVHVRIKGHVWCVLEWRIFLQ